jgi:hypothetical protein
MACIEFEAVNQIALAGWVISRGSAKTRSQERFLMCYKAGAVPEASRWAARMPALPCSRSPPGDQTTRRTTDAPALTQVSRV